VAVTEITPTPLVIDTESADLPDASGTVATTPADGWEVDAKGLSGDRLLFKFLGPAGGDTVTFTIGTNPPAHRAGLGVKAVVLAADDVRFIVVEASRFTQDDGTMLITCVDAATAIWAFLMPKAG